MPCNHPISIVNPTKFIAPQYQQRMLLRVACGKCAGCKDRIRKEYYFRAIHEYKACVASGGYMLFDCLTYRERDVPKISHFYDIPEFLEIDKKFDTYCFNYRDVSLFIKSLREQLVRDGYDVDENLKFFVAAEYGTKESGTHRPHYHILCFVYNAFIEPETLSVLIAQKWKYGRTDGIPYKGLKYFHDVCLIRSSLSSSIRVCKYVAKYVTKDSVYQKKIDKRINRLMFHLFAKNYYIDNSKFQVKLPFGIDYNANYHWRSCYKVRRKFDLAAYQEFIDSPRGKRIRAAIERRLNQFHRQSKGFGICAIDSINYDNLVRSGCVSVVDNDKPVMILALPSYYKRKLFYEQVYVNGVRMWQPTKKGRIYLRDRERARIDLLKSEYRAANINYKLGLTDDKIDDVVRYDMFKRGRIKGQIAYVPYGFEFDTIPNKLFSYITPSDKQHYKLKFVSCKFLGTSQIGYNDIHKGVVLPFDKFIRDSVYLYDEYEDIISKVSSLNCAFIGSKKDERKLLDDDLRYKLKEVGLLT